jgi:uncharacterized BrkB/YihY/UPF0761 family membrane protein
MFLPGLLTYYGVLSLSPQIVRSLAIAGLLGPTLSGLIMTAVTEGRPGVGQLLRQVVRWRVGLRWYLFALVGLPIVMVLGTIIRPAALESLNFSTQPFTLAYLNAFVSMMLIGDHCSKNPGGPASRNLACSGCTVLSSEASSSVASGPCGTCPDS